MELKYVFAARMTPLDKMTIIHDTMEQIRTQEREIMLETDEYCGAGVSGVSDSHDTGFRDESSLLSGVLVQARPLYLHSTLFYIKHFTFSPHPDMLHSVQCLENSLQMLQGLKGKKLRCGSAKMKREYILEDLIRKASFNTCRKIAI